MVLSRYSSLSAIIIVFVTGHYRLLGYIIPYFDSYIVAAKVSLMAGDFEHEKCERVVTAIYLEDRSIFKT